MQLVLSKKNAREWLRIKWSCGGNKPKPMLLLKYLSFLSIFKFAKFIWETCFFFFF